MRSRADPMASEPGAQGRVLGVWGARAYTWSGEEQPRAAGFPMDASGRWRALGFPGEPAALPRRRERRSEKGRRSRLVVAVVAILPGR